ncbi:flippase [Cetobacterium sp.]|uniref:flippase n=1 Tax=Cetobacterium sp. TaxID=2071632 RepID=UPI003F3299B9
MKPSITKNFFYNGIMLILNIGFPIIISPYISRVLGVEKIGEINFTFSFTNLFVLLSSLGFTSYGIREISKIREDKKKLEDIFNELVTLNIISTMIFLIIYMIAIIFVYHFSNNILKLLILYSLNLVFGFLSIDWFYYGIENYEYISKRNLLIKLISLILIFFFVKKSDDVYIYVLIILSTTIISNIVNFIYSKNYVKFKFKLNTKHLFTAKIFYFQILLGSLYTFGDQILLGLLSTNIELGYYSRARQLTLLTATIILCFVKTITPRLSNSYTNNLNEYKKLVNISFKLTSFLIFPCFIGIFLLSKNMMFLFGGNEFLLGAGSLKILSVIIIFSVYTTFLDTHISIPSGNEKNTFYGNVVVAILTITLNILLLKKYGAKGAAISICIGEAGGLIVQILLVRKQKLYCDFFTKQIFSYLLSACFMGLIIRVLEKYINLGIVLNTVILFFIGILSYILGNLLYFKIIKSKDEDFYNILQKIRRFYAKNNVNI